MIRFIIFFRLPLETVLGIDPHRDVDMAMLDIRQALTSGNL